MKKESLFKKDQTFVSSANLYLSEVLGVKHYLCPESVYNLRSLKGGLPCRVLVVVFKTPLASQRILLKKIMASINIFDFTVLEIKDKEVLNQLLSYGNQLADGVCFFGDDSLIEEKRKTWSTVFDKPCAEENSKPNTQKAVSFLQVCSLEELEGQSIEVRNKKKQLWEQLKNWKIALENED